MNQKTIADVLLWEYKDWLSVCSEEITSESLLRFLDKRGALKPRVEMPVISLGRHSHILSVALVTDGDFHCMLEDPWLIYDEYQSYTLTKVWDSTSTREVERDVCTLLLRMKEGTKSHRDYVQEELDKLYTDAVESIRKNGFANVSLGGNYEGTHIVFSPIAYSDAPPIRDDSTEEIRTGLWAVKNDNIDFAEMLESFSTTGLDFGMSVYLYGICGVFALALHDRFGYLIDWALDAEYADGDDPWAHLVHLFCYKPTMGTGEPFAWLDVRGATDDFHRLMEAFEDFFDYPSIRAALPSPDEIRTILLKEMSEGEFEQWYQKARGFIEEHLDWYTIP